MQNALRNARLMLGRGLCEHLGHQVPLEEVALASEPARARALTSRRRLWQVPIQCGYSSMVEH